MRVALFAGIGIGLGMAMLIRGAVEAGASSLEALLQYLLVLAVASWAILTIIEALRGRKRDQ